jgi:hypothetical protein
MADEHRRPRGAESARPSPSLTGVERVDPASWVRLRVRGSGSGSGRPTVTGRRRGLAAGTVRNRSRDPRTRRGRAGHERVAEPDGLNDRSADQGEDEPQAQPNGPVAASAGGVGDGSVLQVRHQVARDRDQVLRDLDQDERIRQEGTFGPYLIPVTGAETTVPVTVSLGPLELLRGIDVIITSANVYLDPSRTHTATLARRIRSAATVRDAAGAMVRDEVAEDLAGWVCQHAMAGRSVPAETIVATSPGPLVECGVRRLYHAALAEPLPTSNGYTVSGEAISRAMLQCFRLARRERDGYDPPLRAISLPLFGAGRARPEPRTSFSRLWPALVAELRVNPGQHIHFSIWRPVETSEVLSGLQRYLERY